METSNSLSPGQECPKVFWQAFGDTAFPQGVQLATENAPVHTSLSGPVPVFWVCMVAAAKKEKFSKVLGHPTLGDTLFIGYWSRVWLGFTTGKLGQLGRRCCGPNNNVHGTWAPHTYFLGTQIWPFRNHQNQEAESLPSLLQWFRRKLENSNAACNCRGMRHLDLGPFPLWRYGIAGNHVVPSSLGPGTVIIFGPSPKNPVQGLGP